MASAHRIGDDNRDLRGSVDDALSTQRVTDRLFTFVSVAYSMAMTTVFPVACIALGEGLSILKALPDAGLTPLENLELLTSGRLWFIITPYCDIVFLAVSLLVSWIGYFFLMAKIRGASSGRYTVPLVVLDLMQALILFATARSLASVTASAQPQAGAAWFGMLLVMLVAYCRVLHGMWATQYGDVAQFDVRTQYTCRTLLGIGIATTLSASVVYLGLRMEGAEPSIVAFQSAIRGSCAVAAMLLLGLLAMLWKLRRLQDELKLDLRESWEWAWNADTRLILAIAVLVFATAGVDYILPSRYVYYLALGLTDALPISGFAFVLIAVAVGAGWWRNRRLVSLGASGFGPREEARNWLARMNDHFDRLLDGKPVLLLVEETPQGVVPVIDLGPSSALARQACKLLAGKVVGKGAASWRGPDGVAVVQASGVPEAVDPVVDHGELVAKRPVMGIVAIVRPDGKAAGFIALSCAGETFSPSDSRRTQRSLMKELQDGLKVSAIAIAAMYAAKDREIARLRGDD